MEEAQTNMKKTLINKKTVSIAVATAVSGGVAVTTLTTGSDPKPYVFGGYAEERKEAVSTIKHNGKAYRVHWIYNERGDAIVSVFDTSTGKQLGKDFNDSYNGGSNIVQMILKADK